MPVGSGNATQDGGVATPPPPHALPLPPAIPAVSVPVSGASAPSPRRVQPIPIAAPSASSIGAPRPLSLLPLVPPAVAQEECAPAPGEEEELGEQDDEEEEEEHSDDACEDTVTHATSAHEAFFSHWIFKWHHGTEEERAEKKAKREAFLSGGTYTPEAKDAPQKYTVQEVMEYAEWWKTVPQGSPSYEAACDKLCDMLDGLEEPDFMAVGAMLCC